MKDKWVKFRKNMNWHKIEVDNLTNYKTYCGIEITSYSINFIDDIEELLSWNRTVKDSTEKICKDCKVHHLLSII